MLPKKWSQWPYRFPVWPAFSLPNSGICLLHPESILLMKGLMIQTNKQHILSHSIWKPGWDVRCCFLALKSQTWHFYSLQMLDEHNRWNGFLMSQHQVRCYCGKKMKSCTESTKLWLQILISILGVRVLHRCSSFSRSTTSLETNLVPTVVNRLSVYSSLTSRGRSLTQNIKLE